MPSTRRASRVSPSTLGRSMRVGPGTGARSASRARSGSVARRESTATAYGTLEVGGSTARKELEAHAVHLGDRVMLHWVGDSTRTELQFGGTVYSGGFVDKRLYCYATDDDLPMPPNLQECMFELQPKQATASGSGNVRSDGDNDEQSNQADDADDDDHDEVMLTASIGDTLRYGDVVVLVGFTRQYVAMEPTKRAEIEAKAFRVELVDELIDGCFFKVLPGDKSTNEGEMVMVHDSITLQCCIAESHYLNISRKSYAGHIELEQTLPAAVNSQLEVNGNLEPCKFVVREFVSLGARCVFNHFSAHADGERRGLDWIGG